MYEVFPGKAIADGLSFATSDPSFILIKNP